MAHDKKILYKQHALETIEELRQFGFEITSEMIEHTIRQPEQVTPGHSGRMIAQRAISEKLVLRVVYEDYDQFVIVNTLYPGRKDRYAR